MQTIVLLTKLFVWQRSRSRYFRGLLKLLSWSPSGTKGATEEKAWEQGWFCTVRKRDKLAVQRFSREVG